MKIQERLQTIGRAVIGSKDPEKLTEKQAEALLDKTIDKALSGATGGFVDVFKGSLSDEESASAKLLEANKGWVYRNNEVQATEVSAMEFELFTSRMVGGQLEVTPIASHPVLDLLDRFNEAETLSDGLFNTVSHKNLAGDAFWLLQGGSMPDSIYLLNPTKTDLILGDFTKQGSRIIEKYVYKDTIKGQPIKLEYTPDEIIQFKRPNPKNPYRGWSKVQALAEDIDLDNLTTHVNKEFFNRGAISNFVLSTEQKLGEEVKNRLRKELTANYGGARNAYKVLLLGGGLKPESIQMSNKDMEFLAQLEWYRDKITAGFGNSKAVIGVTDDVNRANAEASNAQWKESTIRPEMSAITDTLNEFLVPKFGDNLILGFKDPVPENRAEKRKEAIELYNATLITKNEARAIIEFEEVKEGDDFRNAITFNPLVEESIPKSLRHINLQSVLRRNGFYRNQQVYKEVYPKAKKLARAYIAKKNKNTKKEPMSEDFSDNDVMSFYTKLMRVVDVLEERFENASYQLVEAMVEEGISNADKPEAVKDGTIVDLEAFKQNAIAKLEPILMQAVIQGGANANQLLGLEDPYIPKTYSKATETMTEFVRRNIIKFAGFMGEDKIKIMTAIIVSGIKDGQSMPQIRRQIQDKFFGEGREARITAERLTRTEVIKASNAGTHDAYLQSGVVVAEKWLAELDHRTSDICEELDGKIVNIQDDFVKKGDTVAGVTLEYEDIGYPPAHPNCRSTIIPVLIDTKDALMQRIVQLEGQVDKRTKAYRDLNHSHQTLTDYANELEKIIEG